ncbi:MAG: MFS transporter, partial [Comamonadaceae bacterium]
SGANLASSLNIAAFNLGNALGAWAGGVVISAGLGLLSISWAAAGLTAIGLLLALWSSRRPVAAGPALASCS